MKRFLKFRLKDLLLSIIFTAFLITNPSCSDDNSDDKIEIGLKCNNTGNTQSFGSISISRGQEELDADYSTINAGATKTLYASAVITEE